MQRDTGYIVKDDFVVKIDKGRPRKNPSNCSNHKQSVINAKHFLSESAIIHKKSEILSKRRQRHSDFFDIDSQITHNWPKLYREVSLQIDRRKLYSLSRKNSNPF